jgi:peroxiredoxin
MTSKKLLAALFAASLSLSGASLALAQDKPAQKDAHKDDHKDHKDHKHEEKKAEKAKVGQAAPTFTLTDTDGKTVKLADFKGKVVVLEWFNPECPVVVMHYKAGTTQGLVKEFKDKGVVFLAINSGGPGQQGNGTEKNANTKKEWKMDFAILLDEEGTVGRSYGATNTPQNFVIDKDGKLVYAGAIDNGSPQKVGDKNHVRAALTNILAGKPVETAETKAYGCGVKYAAKKDKETKKGG